MRFNRDFELVVRVRDRDVIINPPMRVAFDADKSISGGVNKMQCQIYNLTEQKRLSLVKDAEDSIRIPVSLSVGYQDDRGLIFKGTVQVGKNERQGPGIVTTLECLDGGYDYLNSFTARTVKGGKVAVEAALSDMANTGTGKITDRPVLTRPKVLVGNSAKLIDDTIGPDETWFIDDEKLYIIKDNEVLSRFIPIVSAETGLISTPTREAKLVSFQTLMNPSLKIGNRCQLISTTAPHLDGIYKIRDINFSGDNYGDEWSMTCTALLSGDSVVL